MVFVKKYRLALIVIFLLCMRLFHLGGTVDTPHAWRQYDTKQYIDAYYNGDAKFLEPAVCWMGGHKTLALEFPLPEYLVAQLYKVFGPYLWVARTFFLLCFLASVVYLYKSLRIIFSNLVPEISILIYGLAPLALFYSRAIHIDFFVFVFTFAMLYYCMKAIQSGKIRYLWIALLGASVAFVVKAPYVFYFSIPIVLYAVQQGKFWWFAKRSIIFVLPVMLLIQWSSYAKSINSEIPDWSFIPNFNNFTEMWYWYFGTWRQRSALSNWSTIGTRIVWEVLGYSGSILALLGLVLYSKNKQYYWTLSLVLGTLLYAVLFFNLNLIHNYYQLPFVVCGAVVIAMGIQALTDRLKNRKKLAIVVLVCTLGVFAFESIYFAETNYYTKNEGMELIADEIRSNSSKEDLIVVSFGGLSPQCPLLLQPAGRYGWSIPINDLTPNIIYELWKSGKATKLAVVYNGYFEGEFQIFFEAMENKKGIPIDNNGQVLYICDLKF